MRKILWVCLILFLCGLCVYMNANVDQLLDSDMSSGLVLAKQLSTEGALMSANFYYSTELCVVNSQLIYAPLFSLTSDWHTVRIVGTIILYVILLVSAWYCCSGIGIKRAFPLVGILLITPISIMQYNHLLRGAYYVPHVALSFVLMGLIARRMHADTPRKRWILLICIAVVSLLAGLGGLRVLLVFSIPMLLTSIILTLWNQKSGKAGANPLAGVLGSGLATFGGACVGFLINTLVLAKIYSFQQFNDMQFTAINFENLGNILFDWLRYFGYRTGNVFGRALLYQVMMLLLIAGLFFALKHCLSRREDCPSEQRMLGLFYLLAYGVFILLYLLTDKSYHCTYHLPFAVFQALLIGLWLEKQDWSKLWVKTVTLATVCVVALCTVNSYLAEIDDSINGVLRLRCRSSEINEIVEFVEDEGYAQGYSSFWQGGNMITELSDGRIEMCIFESVPRNADSLKHPMKWLQSKAHEGRQPEGPFFLLFNVNELGTLPITNILDESDVIYMSDSFYVYGYDDWAYFEDSLLSES